MKADAYLAAIDLCQLAELPVTDHPSTRRRRCEAAEARLRQLGESHDAGIVCRALADAIRAELDWFDQPGCTDQFGALTVAESYYSFADPYLYHYLESENGQTPPPPAVP